MLMCTRPLVVFWWLRKNYWSYRNNSYIFGILTKFYLRKVTSYFTCRAIRGLIFSKLPPIDWSVLRSTIWNGQRYYALRCSVMCQGFSYSLRGRGSDTFLACLAYFIENFTLNLLVFTSCQNSKPFSRYHVKRTPKWAIFAPEKDLKLGLKWL